jgi:hypothetical protein
VSSDAHSHRDWFRDSKSAAPEEVGQSLRWRGLRGDNALSLVLPLNDRSGVLLMVFIS